MISVCPCKCTGVQSRAGVKGGNRQREGGSYTEIGCWGDANQIVLINSTEKSEKKFWSLEIPFIIIPVYISNIRR